MLCISFVPRSTRSGACWSSLREMFILSLWSDFSFVFFGHHYQRAGVGGIHGCGIAGFSPRGIGIVGIGWVTTIRVGKG